MARLAPMSPPSRMPTPISSDSRAPSCNESARSPLGCDAWSRNWLYDFGWWKYRVTSTDSVDREHGMKTRPLAWTIGIFAALSAGSTGTARGGERYYSMVFGSQSSPKLLRYTH